MKFKSWFKKSNVITCEEGWLQGSYQGIAFLEYVPKFMKYTFACDAKTFIEALDALDPDFILITEKDTITFTDSKQEISIKQKNGEFLLKLPEDWEDGDIASELANMYKFVSLDYPFIKLNNNYMEVITSTRAIRKAIPFKVFEEVIYAYNIPKRSTVYCQNYRNQFWIGYGNAAYIAISIYHEPVPSTDVFFDKEIEYEFLNTSFLSQLISSEITEFRGNKIFQHSEDLADNIIEGIEGINGVGRFYTQDLIKVLPECSYWKFQDGIIYCKGSGIKAVIGEADV